MPAVRLPRIVSFLIGIFVLATMSVAVPAQEQTIDTGIHKASHNSFQRDETLASQIDDFNVWQIELDICDSGGVARVAHDCADSGPSLANMLQQLNSASRHERFTFIYLDLKNEPEDVGQRFDLAKRISSDFGTALGSATIYPAQQFIGQDKSLWPSHQALLRRGFHWAVIVDWHGQGSTLGTMDSTLFQATGDNPPGPSVFANAVLVNVEGGCDAHPTSEQPALRNGRWLYRYWPSSDCFHDCQQLNGDYWKNGVAKAYNFVATNCINKPHTFDPRTVAPDPLFVATEKPNSCPDGQADCAWGTFAFPFLTLESALGRAGVGSTIILEAGDYPFTGTLQVPATIKSESGPAIIH